MKKNNQKYTYEEVKRYIESLEYDLISKEYKNSNENLVFKDNYYYFVSFIHIKQGYIPKKFHKSNPYTVQNIKLWCKLNNKYFELISDKYEGNNKHLQWKCLIEDCKEIFEATWAVIFSNCGCPFCAGKQVGLSNCLATKNPELAKEWHPTKNGDLTPWNVTCGSGKEIWWKCSTNSKHIWQTSIRHRINMQSDCPYCSHTLPSEDYNLLVINTDLCEEWDYKKNKRQPTEYTPNSHQTVWWKCKECGCEWEASIANRNKDRGCPECNESKGEKKIKKWLKLYNVHHIPQKEFDGLIGLGGGNLSYDFYLPQYNFLIEYQGNFHDGTAKGQTIYELEKQQEHDRRKFNYAKNNNIELLEIWYQNFNNIDLILEQRIFLGSDQTITNYRNQVTDNS